MELFRSNLRRPRLSLAEVMVCIATLGIALKWPVFLLPTIGALLTLFFYRVGFSLFLTLLTMSLIGLVAGMLSAMLRLH
jgi:hypothetical protein